jgi:hypothetical protein
MKALTLNLATRPFRNNTVIGSLTGAAAAALLLATVFNLYVFLSYGSSYALLLEDQARNREKLEGLEREERSLAKQIETRDFATAFGQGSVANELILQRTFSWTELFNRLESLMPPEVMMSAIRPNVTSEAIIVRVEGVAKTHGAFLDLQENLLASASFSDVYPASIRRLNPSRPEITFILNFDYRQGEREAAGPVVAAGAPPPPAGAPGPARRAVPGGSPAVVVIPAAGTADALPVGRDGRPRTIEVIARRMIAPGGIYEPSIVASPAAIEAHRRAAPPAGTAAAPGGEPGSAPAGGNAAEIAAGDGAPPASTGAEIAAGGGTPPSIHEPGIAGEEGAAPADSAAGIGEGGSDAGAAAPLPAASPVPPAAGNPPAPRAGRAPGSPERGRLLRRRLPAPGQSTAPPPGAQGGAGVAVGEGAPDASAPPASGIDLTFSNRPLREIYQELGKAHNVRFVLESAIDRNATLDVDLAGRTLDEVITIMAAVANHRIAPLRAGIYQVTALSGGESIAEPDVEEEDVPAPEGEP